MTTKNEIDVSGRSNMLANVISGWASHFLTILTGFFVPRIMDEQLGQIALGIWDLSWSIVASMTLANLGLASSLNRFVSIYRADGDFEKLRIAASTSAAIQVVAATLVGAVSAVLALSLPQLSPDLSAHMHEAQYVVFILGLSVAIRFLFETSRNVLNGYHRWDISNSVFAIVNLLISILMIVALLLGYKLIAVSMIYTTGTFLEGVIRWRYMRKHCPEVRFQLSLVSASFAAELFRFGITVFLMGIAPVIIVQGTNILIATTVGVQYLAILARPSAILRFIRTLITRFTFTLTPMAGPILRKEGPEELRNFLISSARYGFAFTLPIITLFCVHGDAVIRVWMGDHYVNNTIILTLAIGSLLPLSQSPITRILVGLNYHGRIYIRAMAFGFIVYLMGLTILFTMTTVSMEAFAFLMVTTLSLMNGLFVPYFACRKLSLSIRTYFKESYFKVVILWAIATVPLLGAELTLGSDKFIDAFISGAFYALALGILYWKYLIPNESRQILKGKLRFLNRQV